MTQPAETPRRLFRKAARGKDETTPVLVISGVTVVIAAAVAVLIVIGLLLYFLV